MKDHTRNYTLNYILDAADECLSSVFLREKYGSVMLPMTFIARLDAVLADTAPDVLAAVRSGADSAELCRASRQPFYNTSRLDLRAVARSSDAKTLRERFKEYINGFSPNVAEVLELFGFGATLEKLSETGCLRCVIDKFTSKWTGLGPDPTYRDPNRLDILFPGLSSRDMSALFIELAERFSESVIEAQTPQDVAELMAELLFAPVSDKAEDGEYSVYDGACALGELIGASERRLGSIAEATGKTISAHLYGQEANPEFFALCKAAFLLNAENTAADIAAGSALSADGNTSVKFDFMISCPPQGKSWRADFNKMNVGGRVRDDRFINERSAVPGTANMVPGTRDGQLLYLLNNISKMKDTPLGSRIVEVHSGSLLFSGTAGSAESNARRYMIERDLIEAIIALPKNIFFGSANSAFILVLSNRKEKRREGRIQLINASAVKAPLSKSFGRKNCELNDKIRAEIMRVYAEMEESDVSRVVDADEFGYWAITVESPLRQKVSVNTATIKETLSMFKTLYGIDADHTDGNIPEVGAADIFSFTEQNPKARVVRTPKTWGQVQFEQVYHLYMHVLLDMMREEPYMDYNEFLEKFRAHPMLAGSKTSFTDFEDFMYPLLEKDPNAEIVTRNGVPVADQDLRAVKTVPFTYEGGLDSFLENEILPQNPDAWIDLALTKTGCEINFSKYFYKPKKLRRVSDIAGEIRQLDSEIAELKELYLSRLIGGNTGLRRRFSSIKRERAALETVAEEQYIKNTGLVERNVLALTDGRIVRRGVRLTDETPAYENYQIVFPGNIILRLTEFQNEQTGLRTGVVTEQGIISSSYVCLKISDKLLPEYLQLQLHIADISHAFLELGGGLRRNLGFKDIAKMPVIIIPLAEQRAVVDAVKSLNAPITSAVEKLSRASCALKELENSLIADALGEM